MSVVQRNIRGLFGAVSLSSGFWLTLAARHFCRTPGSDVAERWLFAVCSVGIMASGALLLWDSMNIPATTTTGD